MADPVRLQLSRRRGFNLQEHSLAVNGLGAVNCARPSRWGNHALIDKADRMLDRCYDHGALSGKRRQAFLLEDAAADAARLVLARDIVIELFSIDMASFRRLDLVGFDEFISPLRGKNLACWCKASERCHCDVLLGLSKWVR